MPPTDRRPRRLLTDTDAAGAPGRTARRLALALAVAVTAVALQHNLLHDLGSTSGLFAMQCALGAIVGASVAALLPTDPASWAARRPGRADAQARVRPRSD